MSTTVAAPEVTPERFLAMGSRGRGYELIDGQLVERRVSKESGRIGGEVYFHLRTFVGPARLGWVYPPDVGFRCFPAKPKQVRKADACFVSFARMPAATYTDEGFCTACPDLVAEVLSPKDRASKVEAKRAEWLAAGVTEVWLIDPVQQTVRVHRADGGYAFLQAADTLTTPLLPGFAVPVADLFKRPG